MENCQPKIIDSMFSAYRFTSFNMSEWLCGHKKKRGLRLLLPSQAFQCVVSVF